MRSKIAVALALLLTALGAALAVSRLRPRTTPSLEVVRVDRVLPRSEQLDLLRPGAMALASDGRSAVYVVRRNDTTELMLQYLDKAEPVRIPGTEGARAPFISRDGARIGFFTPGGALQTMDLPDGRPTEVANGMTAASSACFGPNGAIVVSVESEGLRVIAADGTSHWATHVDQGQGERRHTWPQWIAAKNLLLFTVSHAALDENAVAVANIDGTGTHRVIAPALLARYVGQNVVIAARRDGLWALDVDWSSMQTQKQERLAGGVMASEDGVPQFDAGGGHVAYVPEATIGNAIVSAGNHGSRFVLQERGSYGQPRLSPDGKAIAFTSGSGAAAELLVASMIDGTVLRTWRGVAVEPRWTADGRWLVYATPKAQGWELEWVATDDPNGMGTVLTTTTERAGTPWFSGEQYVLESVGGSGAWIVPSTPGAGVATCLVPLQTRGGAPQLRAYVAGETPADRRVFVSGPQVPTASLETESFEPVWSPDGSGLYYRRGAALWRRPLESPNPIRFGAPELVMASGLVEGPCGIPNYDTATDGGVVGVYRDPVERPSTVRFILQYRPEPPPPQ